MSRRLISTGSPFEKTAGYSRAVIDGDFAFVSGTTGYDYATMTMPADITSQTRNCFGTIEAALKEGGFAMGDIVRATYYITDAKDADERRQRHWFMAAEQYPRQLHEVDLDTYLALKREDRQRDAGR